MATPEQTTTRADPAPPKVRVCYFLHGSGVGGASLSLLYLLQQMDRDRYEPVVVFLFDNPMRQAFEEQGIETIVAPGLSYFSHTTGESLSLRNPRGWLQVVMFLPSVLRTYRLVRRLKPTLVHPNSSTLAAQVIGAKLAGATVVWHIREYILDGVVGFRRGLLKWVARRFADALIVITKDGVQRMGAPEKTTLVYNFVDFNRFDRGLRISLRDHEPQRTKTVTMLGDVTRIKGAMEFVQSWPLVQARAGPVRYIIAGHAGNDGEPRGTGPKKWLRQLLGRHRYVREVKSFALEHCSGWVEFPGVVNDVPGLLARTDLVVFPSTEPHFARPVIEAGAMAIPVVASDIPGPRELVRHRETGVLVQPGDPAALAVAIAEVLSDEDLAFSMGEQGLAQAHRLFDATANSSATFEVYGHLLDESSEAPPGQPSVDAGTSPRTSGPVHWLGRIGVALFLGWLAVLFGTYFWHALTLGDRWERIEGMLSKVFS